MSSRAIVYPGKWGNTTLKQIDLNYAKPLPGAIYDWDSSNLPLGPLDEGWASSVDGVRLFQDSASDVQVVDTAGGPTVVLDGVTDRLRIQFELPSPFTIMAVYRLPTPLANQTIWYGYLSAYGRLGVSGGNATMNIYDGSGVVAPDPYVPADSSWNVGMGVMNGAGSVVRINDTEGFGTMVSGVSDGITLGYAGGNTRTPIEIKRLVVFKDSPDLSERNALVARMRLQYGI